MPNNLHLNLLKPNEQLSSSPVRLRIIIPTISLLTTLGLLLWWGILFMKQAVLESQKETIQLDIDTKERSFKEALPIVEQERRLVSERRQLELYRNGANRLTEFLELLSTVVTPQVQLVEFNLPAPQPYNLQPDPRKPALEGPTETVEKRTLRMSGRTTHADPVNLLLKSLQSSVFTNTVITAEIPRGAFRQEVQSATTSSTHQERLLFEINCHLKERTFE